MPYKSYTAKVANGRRYRQARAARQRVSVTVERYPSDVQPSMFDRYGDLMGLDAGWYIVEDVRGSVLGSTDGPFITEAEAREAAALPPTSGDPS